MNPSSFPTSKLGLGVGRLGPGVDRGAAAAVGGPLHQPDPRQPQALLPPRVHAGGAAAGTRRGRNTLKGLLRNPTKRESTLYWQNDAYSTRIVLYFPLWCESVSLGTTGAFRDFRLPRV